MTFSEMKTLRETQAMTNDALCAYLHKLEIDNPKVDFGLLHAMHEECPDMEFCDLISYLEMNDIPMTETVKKLGVAAGILYAWR